MRLRKDTRANVLPLMAAAMIPMFAMIGSAVDISRAYMVKTRLQQACDAGALAARRVMTGSLLDDDARETGENFFESNLKTGDYGAESVSFDLTDVLNGSTATGRIHGEASAQLPTTLMKVFGYANIPMSTECEAQLNVTNNDIMFALDVTGSMGGSRISALREAVKNFFTTVNNATSGNARLRIGFVPYSSAVNVGHLLQPIGAIRTGSRIYQSRVKNERKSTTVQSNRTQTADNSMTSDECDVWSTAAPEVDDIDENEVTRIVYTKASWTKNRNNSKGTCVRNKTTTVYDWDWDHKPVTYDVTNFVNSADGVDDPANFPFAKTTWDGCVEEREEGRDSVTMLATTNARRWWPTWGAISYSRANNSNTYANEASYDRRRLANGDAYGCPKAARRLAVMTQDEVNAYVSEDEGFSVRGFTYHDFGMIWAARLMSTTGLFSSDHGAAPNGKPVLRHIIFMTDGEMNAELDNYSAFGMERWDQRINTSGLVNWGNKGTTEDKKHLRRFIDACAAARADNISIWVVAFGTTLTQNPHLSACADTGQAFEATSSAELNEKFQYIASRIAELRLSE